MLSFEFLKKGLGIVSPQHFVNYFSRKMFLMLYSINWLITDVRRIPNCVIFKNRVSIHERSLPQL